MKPKMYNNIESILLILIKYFECKKDLESELKLFPLATFCSSICAGNVVVAAAWPGLRGTQTPHTWSNNSIVLISNADTGSTFRRGKSSFKYPLFLTVDCNLTSIWRRKPHLQPLLTRCRWLRSWTPLNYLSNTLGEEQGAVWPPCDEIIRIGVLSSILVTWSCFDCSTTIWASIISIFVIAFEILVCYLKIPAAIHLPTYPKSCDCEYPWCAVIHFGKIFWYSRDPKLEFC